MEKLKLILKKMRIVWVIGAIILGAVLLTKCGHDVPVDAKFKYEFQEEFNTVVVSNESNKKVNNVKVIIYCTEKNNETLKSILLEKEMSFAPKEKKILFIMRENDCIISTERVEFQNPTINEYSFLDFVGIFMFSIILVVLFICFIIGMSG